MSIYKSYSADQLEELFSNYLIDSWSYSKVSTFARNEKSFEMLYVYREPERRSISSIAGNAYHEALARYFQSFVIEGVQPDVVDLTQAAYEYLDEVPVTSWRLTDKFPSVDAAIAEATRLTNALIENFIAEVGTYTDTLKRVLSVEVKEETWVTCNGVDIPLPLHYIADLVIETTDGKHIIIDHKSKASYTSDDEIALVHGQQAICYVLGYESSHPDTVIDEVWFIENKYSKNKDKSAQLRRHVLKMDTDSRRLYEYYLYQPLRRMLQAVSDPDYIYTINNSDNLSDKGALYEFSARTILAEVDDWEFIPEQKKEILKKRKRKIKDSSIAMISPQVVANFRSHAASFITFDYSKSNMTNKEKIEHCFRTFGRQIQVAHYIQGFSCDTYLCEVAAGVQLGKLSSYQKDIAYALDVPSVRIASDLVMFDGKSFLSIEVNKKRTETLMYNESYLHGHRIPIGLDNFRDTVVWDLDNHSTPHMLVCGATGSGKSVCIKSTIYYCLQAGIKDIYVLDPKYEFLEMQKYGCKVCNEIEEIEQALQNMVVDMNNRVKFGEKHLTVVIFDEFADAQDQSKVLHKRDKDSNLIPMEDSFKMLLQKGRSCGFRFLAATQRADTKTISGTIKVNFPVLCCFRVPKAVDSKVVIDEEGANTLAGQGDGLLKSPEYLDSVKRFQGFYC